MLFTRVLQRMAQVLLAAWLLGPMAHAGTYLVDDFTTLPVSLSMAPADPVGTLLNSVDAKRSLSVELLARLAPTQVDVNIIGGVFDVSEGGGEIVQTILTWTIPAGVVPPGSTNGRYRLHYVASDGVATSVEFELAGVSAGLTAVPGNTTNADIDTGVPIAQLQAGGQLRLIMNGSAGWDSTINSVSLEWTDPPVAPSPTSVPTLGTWSLAFLSASLAALAARRSRRINKK